ncbi:type II toxin-antitoxin system VapC family toxin [Gracilimonas sediminicola]|uniref:PIN domain-containing protein n=1 Tax=Gracilimonas sediminicola TaxID=2952158 RepID=A0A9X2RH73_9BACT|nr:PIN domain-containing protein [Gracilimonas sediminicola]MCP9292932.1 PIN domain-containing protein [Gracilimonas sediminicola]
MAKTVFIDAGPIVAILNRRDQHHLWASEKISGIEENLVTTSIIISEAFHILRKVPNGIKGLFRTIEEGFIDVEEAYPKNMDYIHKQVLKYSDNDASLGDISILSLVEDSNNAQIFTLDFDFHIYRDLKGNPLDLISPYKQ